MQPFYGRWREGEARYAAMMAGERDKIANKVPMVRGRSLSEDDVYEDTNGGPGQDIYYKGSWTLHSLRWLIGDDAFLKATQLLVYGRPDPRPGNFQPRYGSTRELQAIVARVTGKNYDWFFDVYCRQAALPELVTAEQVGEVLELKWRAPGNLPFPMPIEVEVDGKLTRLAMTDGSDAVAIRPGSHVVIDPWARVLRRSVAIEQVQAWRAAQGK